MMPVMKKKKLKEGWLYCKTSTDGRWQKRWFELIGEKKGYRFRFYPQSTRLTENPKPTKTVQLKEIGYLSELEERLYAFQFTTASNTYLFAASGDNDFLDWYQAWSQFVELSNHQIELKRKQQQSRLGDEEHMYNDNNYRSNTNNNDNSDNNDCSDSNQSDDHHCSKHGSNKQTITPLKDITNKHNLEGSCDSEAKNKSSIGRLDSKKVSSQDQIYQQEQEEEQSSEQLDTRISLNASNLSLLSNVFSELDTSKEGLLPTSQIAHVFRAMCDNYFTRHTTQVPVQTMVSLQKKALQLLAMAGSPWPSSSYSSAASSSSSSSSSTSLSMRASHRDYMSFTDWQDLFSSLGLTNQQLTDLIKSLLPPYSNHVLIKNAHKEQGKTSE